MATYNLMIKVGAAVYGSASSGGGGGNFDLYIVPSQSYVEISGCSPPPDASYYMMIDGVRVSAGAKAGPGSTISMHSPGTATLSFVGVLFENTTG